MRWLALAGVALVVVSAAIWLIAVSLLDADRQAAAIAYGTFLLAVVGVVSSLLAWVIKRAFGPPVSLSLDDELDRLSDIMRDQWDKAAADRQLQRPAPLPIRWRLSSRPVAGPLRDPTMTRLGGVAHRSLPGLNPATAADLQHGDRAALHAIYGGLGSGRLIVVGASGAGKSAVAILLLLDALRFRKQAAADDRVHIPVPVMFTLHGWDPHTVRFEEWLQEKLGDIQFFRGKEGVGRVATLIRDDRLAVFLDGFDEMDEPLRATALQALNDQAPCRLVLLSRPEELEQAVQQTPLLDAVAVELQPLKSADAASYLLDPLVHPAPPAWRAFTDALTSASPTPVVGALNNPLMVTLLRDTYGPTDAVDELLDDDRFSREEDIVHHVLDKAVPAAYAYRPGHEPGPYNAQIAEHTLGFMAQRLARDGHGELVWWWDMAEWSSRTARFLAAVLIGVLVASVAIGGSVGVAHWFFGGYAIDQWGTVLTGLISGTAAGLGVGYMSTKFREYLWEPYDERGWLDVDGWLRALSELTYGAVVGALSGAMAGAGFGLALALVSASPSPDRFSAAFVTGLAGACAGGLISGAGLAVILRLLSDLVELRQILDTLWVLASLSIGVVAGLVFGLAIGVGREGLSGSADNGAAGDWWFPFGVGASVGVITGLAAHRAVSQAGREPQRIRAYWWRRPITLRGMAAGLVVGSAIGIAIGLPAGLITGLAFGVPIGLAVMLAASLIQPGTSEDRVTSPRDTWRQDLNAAIMGGLTTGLAFGVLGGLAFGLRFGATSGVLAGLSVGLGTALLVGLTASLGATAATALGTAVLLPTVLSQSLLAIRHRTPWRMLRFLEDAQSRNLLRTVGPDYQFRHAKLQDRLARQWLLTVAEKGDISAMVDLGFLAVHVDPPQLEEARYWFNRAVDAGYSEARTYLSEIDDDLTTATGGNGYHESEDTA